MSGNLRNRLWLRCRYCIIEDRELMYCISLPEISSLSLTCKRNKEITKHVGLQIITTIIVHLENALNC